MRISRLTAGLVTVGLVGIAPLAVTAPAQAAALGSTTTLTVSAPIAPEPGNVPSYDIGDTLSFSGGVKGSDNVSTPTTGTATLQVYTAAAPVWTPVATDTSPSSLFFSGVVASSNAQYKVVFSGGTSGSGSTANTYAASESAPVAVAVARTVKAKTSGLKVIGKVTPDFGKSKIKILQKKGKKYKKFTTVKSNKKGKFTFRAPGRSGFRFAVVVPGDANYTSKISYYRVF